MIPLGVLKYLFPTLVKVGSVVWNATLNKVFPESTLSFTSIQVLVGKETDALWTSKSSGLFSLTSRMERRNTNIQGQASMRTLSQDRM